MLLLHAAWTSLKIWNSCKQVCVIVFLKPQMVQDTEATLPQCPSQLSVLWVEEERLLLSVMLPLHSFQLPCMLPGWRADRKACICQQLSMCPGKLIFGTETAGCALQCHGTHWAARGIKAFLSTSAIYGKWDSSLPLPRNNLLQTPSFRHDPAPEGKKKIMPYCHQEQKCCKPSS